MVWGYASSMKKDAVLHHADVATQLADTEKRSLLHAQLTVNAGVVRASVVGNAVNAIACAGALLFYQALDLSIIALMLTILVVLAAWRMQTAKQVTAIGADDSNLDELSRRTTVNAILLGICWGAITYALIGSGQHDLEMLGGIVGAGMMSAGAVAYRTRRSAAMGYVLTCATGGFCGLAAAGHPAALAAMFLLACFLAVLRANIQSTSDRFDASHKRNGELAKSAETIQLLLNDVTEQGSDWLIEVDRQGRIVNPSPAMVEASGRSADELSGLPFGQLIDEGPLRETLKRQFIAGEIIQRQTLSLHVRGEQRWWTISARPSRDGYVRYRGVVTDITAQRIAEERVSYLAHYDGLTNLPNRFLFSETLEHALQRDDRRGAVMYLDLDNFKNINDTLGHGVGDQVLQACARRIENLLGKYDLAARFGGDEFAILIPASRMDMVDQLAWRIVNELARPIALDHHDVVVGASLGIACAPTDGTSADALLRRADLALYAAKAQGRGRALRFEVGMDDAAQARRAIEMDLRGALSKGELCLHYQPLVHVASGEISGYEALIRWNHPDRGLVMPNSFIPIAEETGMIIAIGEWVIRQALADAATWPDNISISINLSPTQMRSPSLVSTVVQALAQSGVAASRVCLEITESVLMQDSESNIETLHKLRSFGLQISLDDFGTGYSSLNYLRSFPFSKIKIDRCFVSEIDQRDDCQAIVRSVVSLAESLGMSTIAEGVEREEQAVLLSAEGCGELQGFLYSKAIPAGEISEYFDMLEQRSAAAA
jgi:diguanylate cyclase (GGDEF)-like protein/PAS domain S-box-containing protein